MQRRSDPEKRTVVQTDRFFRVNDGQWYFMTRDDGDRGPFPSRDDAEQALFDYIREKTGEYNPAGAAWLVPGAGT
jgi:hypothetical protein